MCRKSFPSRFSAASIHNGPRYELGLPFISPWTWICQAHFSRPIGLYFYPLQIVWQHWLLLEILELALKQVRSYQVIFLTYPKLIGHVRIMRGTTEREREREYWNNMHGQQRNVGARHGVVQICTQLTKKKFRFQHLILFNKKYNIYIHTSHYKQL